ncbi:GumC family protein [Marinobacterium rhizophilum]|uniref:GumC family protein n=1 Tax=Marinobacterium rhizophilum TaxID=420402 RepID=UPI00037D6861|nr:polysaccharide biosynthesis tyrosine autokinase [Marinobacterium rhizophilum]
MENQLIPQQPAFPDRLGERQPERIRDDELDLLRLWQPIWRRKWSIATLMLVVMMLATLVALAMTPVYRAASTLMIEEKAAQVLSIQQVYGLDGNSSGYLQTQFELLKSRELAERVVHELSLNTHPEFDPRQQSASLIDIRGLLDFNAWLPFTTPEDVAEVDPELAEAQAFRAAVDTFMKRTTITPVPKTQLVKVQIEMADASTAARAANALARTYIDSQMEAKLEMTNNATRWINERLETLKVSLQESERQLQAFRDQENLVDLQGGVTTVSAGELSRTSDRLVDTRRDRDAAESQYRQVAELKGGGWQRLTAAPAVMSNPLVQQFKAQEAQALSKVQELSNRYGPKHPSMIAARSELNTATASLKSQVEQVVASIERAYQLAVANEDALQSSFELNKDEIQAITRKEFKLRELQREVDSNQALYNTFLNRLKETSATADLQSANARIVDRAVRPEVPVKPNRKLIVIAAGLLALMAGVGLALLLEMLNNTFKSTEEIEEQLNLPVLGILPLLKDKLRKDVAQMFGRGGETDRAFLEAIRTLRTGVVLSGLNKEQKVLLVTSSIPGEGKSSVAANLAQALGQMEKVLLIDADMRRPTAAKNFELPVGTPGLANLIAGIAKLEDCIYPLDGVDLISAGTVPPNPLELLSSKRFAETLEVLGSKYDHIIIDSPPMQAVSDALMLSALASSVIYVVKAESTSVQLVRDGIGRLLQNRAPVSGVVLNQVDIEKAKKNGYSHGAYYDYGYSSDQPA